MKPTMGQHFEYNAEEGNLGKQDKHFNIRPVKAGAVNEAFSEDFMA